MNANRFLKIALVGLSTAALIPTGQIFGVAEGAEKVTHYPEAEVVDGKTVLPFERELSLDSSLSDYAIHPVDDKSDNYAFACGPYVYVLTTNDNDERHRVTYVHSYGVKSLDFDSEGTLYYKDTTGVTYTLDYLNEPAKPTQYSGEHEFKVTDNLLVISDKIFYTLNNNDGMLSYWEDGVQYTIDEGFSQIKTYGNEVYAVKDNRPYQIIPSKVKEHAEDCIEPLSLYYIDTDSAMNIYTGDVAEQLKRTVTTADITQIAEIKKGAYYTQIDLNEIGEIFTIDENGGTQKAESNKRCLVLCSSGNASIISIGDSCFITATDNLEKFSDCATGTDNKTYYAVTDTNVYSYPVMCKGASIAGLKSGAEHTVKIIERLVDPVLATEFCKVSYEEDGKTVIGYVASNYLTVYNFSAEDKTPGEGGDEQFNYDTNVTSVILAIVIVALVIIAVLYVILANSKGKKKKKKRKKEKKDTAQSGDELTDLEE